MRHVLSALVMNRPGVLAHISGMLASREFNIESLAVGATENPEFSRMTFVVAGDARVLDQIRKQLEKIVTVVRVIDYSNQEFVERDLMLIKVSTPDGARSQVKELVDIFRCGRSWASGGVSLHAWPVPPRSPPTRDRRWPSPRGSAAPSRYR